MYGRIRINQKTTIHRTSARRCKKACERAGVSPTVFQSALRKTKIDNLTDKEMKVLFAFREILDERTAEREKLKKLL